MANLSSVLNEQIRRLARREIRSNTKVVRRATAQYRHDIAALKRQVTALGKLVGFLQRQENRRSAKLPVPQGAEGRRFRVDGLRSHRKRLGISARDYGALVGVSGLTIYHWEGGKARPRRSQLAKLATVRGIGKREAMRRLELLNGK